jgi:hypothetical protein
MRALDSCKLNTFENHKSLTRRTRKIHTKINTQQNDPNFLTHVIWSKTSLVVQHIHLELVWNLSYKILKKNKHNSRINISYNYKIVIN